jgi:hypothetical protein
VHAIHEILDARNSGGGVLREYDKFNRGDAMRAQRRKFQVVAAGMTVLIGLGVGTGIYAKEHRRNGGAEQETEASREKNAQSTTLSDHRL